MLGTLAAWIFAVFLYLKIALDAAFNRDATIIATLLMAATFGIVIYFVSAVYTTQLMRYNARALANGHSIGAAVGWTIAPFVVVAAVYLTVSRLIVFGFSKDLHRRARAYLPLQATPKRGFRHLRDSHDCAVSASLCDGRLIRPPHAGTLTP